MSKQFKFKVGDRVKIPVIKFGRPVNDDDNTSHVIDLAWEQGHNYLIVSKQPSKFTKTDGRDCYIVRYKRNHNLDGGDYFHESDLEFYEPVVNYHNINAYKLISDVWIAEESANINRTIVIGLFERIDDSTKECIRVDIKTGDTGMMPPSYYKQYYTLTRLATDDEFDMLIKDHIKL